MRGRVRLPRDEYRIPGRVAIGQPPRDSDGHGDSGSDSGSENDGDRDSDRVMREPADDVPAGEFDDEPPGAYLRELRAGPWTIAWSVINLVATVAVAAVVRGALGADDNVLAPLAFVWALLPASCLLAAIVSGWLVLLDDGPSVRAAARWALGLALVALGLWLVLRYGFGIAFSDAARGRPSD